MKVTVNINMFALRKQIEDVAKVARTAMAEAALKDITPMVPWETHTLQMSGQTHSNFEEGQLTWATPYAKVRYYKGNPKKAGTTTHWVEKAAEQYSDDWIAVAERKLRR